VTYLGSSSAGCLQPAWHGTNNRGLIGRRATQHLLFGMAARVSVLAKAAAASWRLLAQQLFARACTRLPLPYRVPPSRV